MNLTTEIALEIKPGCGYIIELPADTTYETVKCIGQQLNELFPDSHFVAVAGMRVVRDTPAPDIQSDPTPNPNN